jgi:hypothetical protein
VERIVEVGLAVLAVLGFIGWLGGGRKWTFRTLLSAVVLIGVGLAGILLYGYVTDKVAELRAQQIRACAIAKVAKAQCQPPSKDAVATTQDPYADIAVTCPPYMLFDNPTPEQENAAVAAAEEECAGEIDPTQKSLHEQISEYKLAHGIVEKARGKKTEKTGPWTKYQSKGDEGDEGDVFDQAAARATKRCAAKVRSRYPHVYDDLDDATLAKKVLAKYPRYCDVTSFGIDSAPEIKNIR